MMKLRCDFESKGKLVGGHVSIAESIDMAPERADSFGFNTFQIFVKSNLQWKYREIKDEEYGSFRNNVKEFKMKKPVVHATYLLNLGSENKDLIDTCPPTSLPLLSKSHLNFIIHHHVDKLQHMQRKHRVISITAGIQIGPCKHCP